MDRQALSRLQRDDQNASSLESASAAQVDGRLKNLHTCMPGIIESYDATKQTAKVQPCIKRLFLDRGWVNLPVCVDVPVCFPGGGDFFLTFPVKQGDECILMFSERSIDFWYANGGIQQPSEYRLHDLSDGMAIVGINSQPRKLSDVQTDGVELRSRARTTYIKMTEGEIFIKGNITHEGNTVQTGNISSTGTVTNNNKNIGSSHKHVGVVPGGGASGIVQ
jgi:hypothetical protein